MRDETDRGRPPGATGTCTTIPPTAQTLSMNVTALDATEQTFLTIWPDGPLPVASSLNPAPGQPPTPNAVKVDLSGAGTFNVFNERGEVNVIVDVDGYFEHHHHDDRSGVEYTKGNSLIALTVAHKVVGSIVLNTPAPGYAVVTASGYWRFDATGEETARCSITAGATVINEAQLIIGTSPTDAPAPPALEPTTYQSFSSTVVHEVPAGATTFNLVCEEFAGDDVSVGDASLTAQYVPTRL